jgi:hypothetical protein
VDHAIRIDLENLLGITVLAGVLQIGVPAVEVFAVEKRRPTGVCGLGGLG